MLLREQPLAQLASIDPAQQQIPRGKSGSDEDGDKHPPVHVSAVSIGASTPVEEIDNRIP
jgi:hypothetical protein